MLAAADTAFPCSWPTLLDHDPTVDDDPIFELEDGQVADTDGGDRFLGPPIPDEADLLFGPLSPDPVLEFEFCNGGYVADDPFSQEGEADSMAAAPEKKLTHNAYERSRRRKLNDLYCTLRSLLPYTRRQKKLSIPSTVAEALAYIPELQNRIAELTKRKEEILSSAARRQQANPGSAVQYTSSNNAGSYPVVSTSSVGDRELMVQICYLSSDLRRRGGIPKIIGLVESAGFRLINASTSRIDDDRTSCRVHVEVTHSIGQEHSDFTNRLDNMLKEDLGSG